MKNFNETMNSKKKEIMITVPAAILLLALYVLIFGFSAQDGERSGSLSQFISEKCVELLNAISGKHWSEIVMEGLAEYFEHPIRKLAHFTEYACMGVLVHVIWSQWLRRGKGLYLLTVGWVFLSAAVDEIHQYFIPGRYASFADVCLDTAGGAFGMLLCVVVLRIWEKRRKIKTETDAR